MKAKYRVRDTLTGKIIGYEALLPANIDKTQHEWASTENDIDWRNGVLSGQHLWRDQFTGLKDSNGNDVYEDDILEIDGARYEVIWVHAGFYCAHIGGGEGMTLEKVAVSKHCCVIGNRFENPDLAEA
jgi:hypothetical protein